MSKGIRRRVASGMVMAATATLGVATTSAEADLLAYEGFAAGGANPNPALGQYETGTGFIPSGDDAPGDSLATGIGTTQTPASGAGQNPTALGFTGSWNVATGSAAQFATTVYPRAETGGLSYADQNASSLATTPGQVNFFRSSAGSGSKLVRRSLDGSQITNDSGRGYAAILIQFTSGQDARWGLGSGNEATRIGFNPLGQPYVESTEASRVTGTTTYATDATHLMLVEFLDNAAGNGEDLVNLYINPTNLLDPLADGPVITEAAIGQAFNGTMGQLQFWPIFANAGGVIYDEFRAGSSATSVVPVPEPVSAGLLGIGLLAMMRRR